MMELLDIFPIWLFSGCINGGSRGGGGGGGGFRKTSQGGWGGAIRNPKKSRY